jgi:hypothetical protein
MNTARDTLILPLLSRYADILRRVLGDGTFPETHLDGLSDCAFLDIEALRQAGYLETVKRGRYQGIRITEAGLVWLAKRYAK